MPTIHIREHPLSIFPPSVEKSCPWFHSQELLWDTVGTLQGASSNRNFFYFNLITCLGTEEAQAKRVDRRQTVYSNIKISKYFIILFETMTIFKIILDILTTVLNKYIFYIYGIWKHFISMRTGESTYTVVLIPLCSSLCWLDQLEGAGMAYFHSSLHRYSGVPVIDKIFVNQNVWEFFKK